MISLVLFFLAGIMNACMDALRYRWNTSIFRFWKNQDWVNPSLSWTRKWLPKSKIGDLIMSTVLVWTTDFWHLCKAIMLFLITAGVIFYQPLFVWWVDFILFRIAFSATFELFFSKILIKK